MVLGYSAYSSTPYDGTMSTTDLLEQTHREVQSWKNRHELGRHLYALELPSGIAVVRDSKTGDVQVCETVNEALETLVEWYLS